ncbi:MAG: hypothetical protein AAF648_05400 [Pseudomonadota bacterium]
MFKGSTLIRGALIGATLMTAGTALAGNSSPAELRGFDRCVNAVESDSRGLVVSRNYLINNNDSSREYFINGTRWESGDRAEVRINCETTRSGRRLIAFDVAPGRYIDSDTQVTIEVAGN